VAFFLIKNSIKYMLKWLEKNLPKVVLAPAVGLISWFVYGFVLWTFYISFTNSKIPLPNKMEDFPLSLLLVLYSASACLK
jgi:ABC-type sugar transport system permease subunit